MGPPHALIAVLRYVLSDFKHWHPLMACAGGSVLRLHLVIVGAHAKHTDFKQPLKERACGGLVVSLKVMLQEQSLCGQLQLIWRTAQPSGGCVGHVYMMTCKTRVLMMERAVCSTVWPLVAKIIWSASTRCSKS